MKRLRFVVVVAAVVGCQTDRPLHSPLTADIQDATNGGPNDFFFWLPPIRNQPPIASQVLSRQLRPVITITNEGPAGSPPASCTPGTVDKLEGSDITVSEAHYHANWDTDQHELSAGCKYRITVRVGSTVLGFADVDVVGSGKELRNVDDEDIPLLDGRTLPIKFFVGVGSLCGENVADCGEGVARGGENATIVTTSGRAGVFIPADALVEGVEVAITVKSVDGDRSDPEFECIPNLFQQYPGTADVADNACYDYDAEPVSSEIGIEQSGRFEFDNPVTVGICADVVADALGHPTRDLLQIFQFDEGEDPVALNNVAAPFLRCDPNFSPNFGAHRSLLGDLARAFASLLTPRPLYASSNRMMLDIGTGGETEFFSRFTWALPADVSINFDEAPDESAVSPGTLVNTLYSRLGVTFTRTIPEAGCGGSGVYANSSGGEQNDVSVCPGTPSEFSEDAFGAIQATFTLPAVQACIEATPIGDGETAPAQAYIEAFSATDAPLNRAESSIEGPATQRLCVSSDEEGGPISFVRFAGKDAGLAIFDNFLVARALPPSR